MSLICHNWKYRLVTAIDHTCLKKWQPIDLSQTTCKWFAPRNCVIFELLHPPRIEYNDLTKYEVIEGYEDAEIEAAYKLYKLYELL